jgi:hypothetical protein
LRGKRRKKRERKLNRRGFFFINPPPGLKEKKREIRERKMNRRGKEKSSLDTLKIIVFQHWEFFKGSSLGKYVTGSQPPLPSDQVINFNSRPVIGNLPPPLFG